MYLSRGSKENVLSVIVTENVIVSIYVVPVAILLWDLVKIIQGKPHYALVDPGGLGAQAP